MPGPVTFGNTLARNRELPCTGCDESGGSCGVLVCCGMETDAGRWVHSEPEAHLVVVNGTEIVCMRDNCGSCASCAAHHLEHSNSRRDKGTVPHRTDTRVAADKLYGEVRVSIAHPLVRIGSAERVAARTY